MVTALDGDDWQLQGWLGDEWRWHVNKPWDAPGWLPARVPGSVLDDLERAGEVGDLRHQRSSRRAEWVPERAWIYRRLVTGPGLIHVYPLLPIPEAREALRQIMHFCRHG